MAGYCTFFLSSLGFTTVCALYCSVDGSALLILPIVSGFPDGLRAVLLNGWQRIAHSSARSRLSRRCTRRSAQRMAADCKFFLSSMAFMTVCALYCSTDGSASLILPLITGFSDGLRAVLLSGWQRIPLTSGHQRLSPRFARRIAKWMAADCSFFRSSMAFTVCALYFSANGSGLLILPLINGFPNGLRADFLSGCQYIVRSSAPQRLFRRFARRIAQRMAANCSFFRSLTSLTTVCAPYYSADGDRLHIISLVNGFHDGLRTVLLRGWQRIAHSFAH